VRHPNTTDIRRARWATLVFLILTTLVFWSSAGPARATLRSRYRHMINNSRDKHDLRAVKLNLRLSKDAKVHTRKMIRRGKLFDVQDLADLLDPYEGFKRYGGGVVACGESLADMHQKLMHHAYHRKIILSGKVRFVGIGTIAVSGRSGCGRNQIWGTAIFYG